MNKIVINPSIATIVDINPVGYNEIENIYFKAQTNWLGSYDCKIFNSDKKNQQFIVANNLTVVNDLMTFLISPATQGLEPKVYYYEIWSITQMRVIFKVERTITK